MLERNLTQTFGLDLSEYVVDIYSVQSTDANAKAMLRLLCLDGFYY